MQRQKQNVNFGVKVQEEFQKATKLLEQSRNHFGKRELSIAKTWFVQAELVLEVMKNFEDFQILPKDQLSELQSNLERSIETFEKKEYEVLSTKCALMQARILFQIENFIECRQKVIWVIINSKGLQLKETQQEATKLFNKVSLKIQIEFNNVFVFAKAWPINCKEGMYNIVAAKGLVDDRDNICEAFAQTRKQLDVKFTVLSLKFLENIREQSSQVLHLTPFMF